MSAAVAVPGVTPAPVVELIPVSDIKESSLNPRKTFTGIEELAEDVGRRGVLQPVMVRRMKAGYELVFGARRFRAAKLAKLAAVPAMVRELSDQEALELMVIENAKRADVHPLEEAQGFYEWHHKYKQSVPHIAERTGRSASAVYDSLRLLNLTKDAQKYFLEGKFSLSHAIILSRLEPETQKRVLDVDEGILFHGEATLFDPRAEEEESVKACSVRELQAWVDGYVKFDTADTNVPQLFPETAAAVKAATEDAEKIIQITYQDFVRPEAKDGSRILGPRTWKRADGRDDSKTCDFSVTGIIVIGPGRGEAFKVCTNKDKCTTHWAKEQREKAQRAKAAAGGAAEKDSYAKEQQRREAERAKEEVADARWKKALPAIAAAVNDRVKALPAKAVGELADIVVDRVYDSYHKAPSLPRGKSAEDLVRYLASYLLNRSAADWNGRETFPRHAKKLGIDIAKVLDEAVPLEPKPEPAVKPGKKPAAKKASKKKGGKK